MDCTKLIKKHPLPWRKVETINGDVKCVDANEEIVARSNSWEVIQALVDAMNRLN